MNLVQEKKEPPRDEQTAKSVIRSIAERYVVGPQFLTPTSLLRRRRWPQPAVSTRACGSDVRIASEL
jgi:hypothetical protein